MQTYTHGQLYMQVYTYGQLHMQAYTQNSNTLDTDRTQHNSPHHVIAQHYSSALVSLHIRWRKENFGVRFKDVIVNYSFFFLKKKRKCVSACKL
jgi:hypothetical protein